MFLFSLNENNQATENNISTTDAPIETVKTEESFLSTVEYGKLLYINPRGISCAKCHGEKGKGGQKIAKYYDKEKNPKILKGVDIREYSLEDLKASLKNEYKENNQRKRHKIMPMYYLTDKEVKAIHTYLQSK
ncbi:cytochrome c [bacterium]|nr:cytochrome c [bacterium]MBU1957506.1 cytochrome c [bacterium]